MQEQRGNRHKTEKGTKPVTQPHPVAKKMAARKEDAAGSKISSACPRLADGSSVLGEMLNAEAVQHALEGFAFVLAGAKALREDNVKLNLVPDRVS